MSMIAHLEPRGDMSTIGNGSAENHKKYDSAPPLSGC